MKKYKWAILGPGVIAHKFADGLTQIENAELYAVGELPQFYDKACEFAKEYDVKNVYKGIDALCEDKEIDIVYIPMINTMHKEAVLACLNSGKNVLCEKPIAINGADLEEMIDCAKKNDLFLMEALFSQFMPSVFQIKEWIASGLIGEVRTMTAEFAFRAMPKVGRLYDINLGGGALLDLGAYTIGLPLNIMGKAPNSVVSDLHIGPTGVDEVDSIIMKYDDGICVRSFSSITTAVKDEMFIYGTKGYIHLSDYWHAEKAELYVEDEIAKTFYEPFVTNGYNFEAEEVMKCLDEGKKESSIASFKMSRDIVKIMDEARSSAGFKYNCE